MDGEQIMKLQEVVRQVVVADHIFAYVADLVRATRPREANVPKWVPELLGWGAGPLGALAGGLLANALGLRAPFFIAGAISLVALIPAGIVLTPAALAAAEPKP